ncbi:hypothetical protein BJ875DRAFT_499924 [Amylocarpus encephaloides]|uniref:Gfo/Idh/MocA-like oxidoreductase N-terminal domain-containing protein n=1 Tax=Amylocarpus encephaloides TaxID=45428 RepID=A0A9P7Y9V5_9HELO|nr:hypothetical protein BJ875DRAFT_499924 [Amylocarpus encephaloides]
MAPIRTAFIGISSSTSSWAAKAHLPYLVSQRGREKFEIVALYNLSVEAAQHAIKIYDFPPTTKAYGDPEKVAADLDIDLVVNCTRVDLHYTTTLPSVRAGKAVYVEWPLAHDVDHARKLASAARQSGSRTVVGNQGRISPIVLKIKELLGQELIGKVLSSEFRASGGPFDGDIVSLQYKFLTQKASGGNVVSISFAHLWDLVQSVLGEVVELRPNLQIQRSNIRVIDPHTMSIVETVRTDVPDLINITGTIAPSDTVVDGAKLLARYRRGEPFPEEPALVWVINGEREIRLVSPGSSALHATAYFKPVTLEVHSFASGSIQRVDWSWSDWKKELPIVSRSVGALYEAFTDQTQLPIQAFDLATHRLEQLYGILADKNIQQN